MNYEEDIKNILNKLPSENLILDYKLCFYSENKRGNLIKDVLSLLNGIESYWKDKFLIFGVDDQKIIKGLTNNFPDDNEIQSLLINNIEPKIKNIVSGEMTFENKKIGYIVVVKSNVDVPYQVSSKFNKDGWKISAGQRYIRFGSTNQIMTTVQSDELTKIKILSGNYKGDIDLIKKVQLSISELKSKYTNEDFSGLIEFYPENNNGIYTIGKNEFLFNIKFDVANNDVVRIYEKNYRVGYKQGFVSKYFDFEINSLLQYFDFSSRFRRMTKNKSLLLINEYGKKAIIHLITAHSSGHGYENDYIKFLFSIKCE